MAVAACTLPTDGCVALPLVENDSKRHARPDAEQVPRQLRGGDRDVGQLLHGRIGNDAAIGHEQHAVLAEARVLDLHDHAARRRGDVRRGLDDLEQRPQHAAGDVRRRRKPGRRPGASPASSRRNNSAAASPRAPRCARIPFSRRNGMKALGEIVQVLALGGIDDADAFQRNVQVRRRPPSLWPVAEQNGRAQPQRIKLPRGLQDARLRRLRETPPAWDAAAIFR